MEIFQNNSPSVACRIIFASVKFAGFSGKVESDPRVSAAVKQQVGLELEGNVSFVSIDQVRAGAQDEGLDAQSTEAIVDSYADAQLRALKTGLLVAGLLVCAAFFATRNLPSDLQAARPPLGPVAVRGGSGRRRKWTRRSGIVIWGAAPFG